MSRFLPSFQKAIVLIGEGEFTTKRCSLKNVLGTGFIYNHSNQFHLLTCHHVITPRLGTHSQWKLSYWLTNKDGTIVGFPFDNIFKKFKSNWIISEIDDIAVCKVGFDVVNNDIFTLQKNFIAKPRSVRIGEDVLFLGYPMGLIEKDNISPFVRKGIISRIFFGDNKMVIDGYSIGGSSGSPVFLRPGILKMPLLVGMIQGHLLNPANKQENPSLAFAVKMETISSFLEKNFPSSDPE